MTEQTRRRQSSRLITRGRVMTLLALGAGWLVVIALMVGGLGWEQAKLVLLAAAVSQGVTVVLAYATERVRWAEPIRRLSRQVELLANDPAERVVFEEFSAAPWLSEGLNRLATACRRSARSSVKLSDGSSVTPKPSLTRSAMLESTSESCEIAFDPMASGDFSTTDMVNRLEPSLLRWLESSPAEQEFLGWSLRQLREKSFLEMVHPDDLPLAKEQLRTAMVKGEAHGLILRIRTAHGKPKAIEVNVGARYGTDMTLSHLRCHVTDVTAKVRAERELKLRTRELTQVNDQLRIINRELEELKERYLDLYQNAPTMYFSLDNQGRFLDCNDTLLTTLGYRREVLIGQSYAVIMPDDLQEHFQERFRTFLQAGTIELTTRWVKASGEMIDIWVTGTAVRDKAGRIIHSRSVAQDVTARHRLEAELQEKNARLARTIEELSRRNKEMDEFTYVVSHDLQEPLRTLTAFSDFLLRDYGDRLDAEGQEFVRYIVDASRRMRALIQDLLTLSRAGKVTAEFAAVNLGRVIDVIRADLAELIRSKGAELRVIEPLPEVWGDRQRLGQLLTNLISNALKYNDKSEPAVEVGTVSGEPDDDDPDGWVTLYVKDNGIGIDSQFHARIFQLFRRLHTREEYEGTGAGLAICDKIVAAHGGRIWVESASNQGATFYVTLRRSPHELCLSAPIKPPDHAHAT